MKLFYCCLFAGVFSLALADVKHVKESAVEKKVDAVASDKSSDSKPKRDASHLSGVYHGPSYKYLPPSSISSSYDSYSGSLGNSAGYSGGHISGVGGGYSSGGSGIGRGHNHVGFSSSGHYNSGASHGLGYAPASSYHGSGHHGLGFTSSSHYAGHGATQHSGGFKGGAGSQHGVAFGHGEFSAGRPHSYAVGHGYSSSGSSISGLGYKSHSHSLGGGNAGSGSGYHYSKGISGSFPSSSSSGFGSGQGFSSSHGSGLAEVHHGHHVHNGGQEHIYVISNGPSGYGNSHGAVSVGQQGSHEVPTASYLPPVQQHPLPSSSYGVPITTGGDSYNTKYHSQQSAVIEHGPAYAAGHKGLGHFGFAASKPQVLHTSITGSGFKQPSYSKAPFKPSEFLGAKYEGGAHNDAPGQQYLPPSGVGSGTTGYDYPIPSGSSVSYQEPSYQQTVEVQATSVHEPDSAYLPPNNNEGSFNELPSAPSGNYLPPSNSYGVPYSH